MIGYSPRMIATGPDDGIRPPLALAINALHMARAQQKCVFLFATDDGWRMTTAIEEPPASADVWEFPAGSSDLPH